MLTSLDYYRVFYYVAKHRNFTRAADVLTTSQPTVTRTIKQLESDLGCRLFERDRRGVRLTAEGELLYSYIAPAYERIMRGEEKLVGKNSLSGGSVYVSATETSLHCFLLEKLGLFHDRHPQIQLIVANVSTTQAIENVVVGRSDFAFVASPAEVPEPLRANPAQHLPRHPRGQRTVYRARPRQLCPSGLEAIPAHFQQPHRLYHLSVLSGRVWRRQGWNFARKSN